MIKGTLKITSPVDLNLVVIGFSWKTLKKILMPGYLPKPFKIESWGWGKGRTWALLFYKKILRGFYCTAKIENH